MKRKYTPTENLKDYISESLLILMRKKGFADISISEITDKAGVNRSSYYRNFDSKEEILIHFYNKIIFELMEKVKNKKDITLQNYLEMMFSYFYQYKNELLLIYKNKMSNIILDALNEAFKKIEKKQSFDDLFKIYYHTGGIYNSFLLWFSDNMCQSPKQMAKLSISILPKSFKPILL